MTEREHLWVDGGWMVQTNQFYCDVIIEDYLTKNRFVLYKTAKGIAKCLKRRAGNQESQRYQHQPFMHRKCFKQ